MSSRKDGDYMTDQYGWNRGRNTSDEIADEDDPRYETPLGAQQKADTALADAKEYTDEEIEALPDIVGGIGITVTDNLLDNTKVITATGIALPAPHAFTHVTGGDDVLPDAVSGGDSGLMTGTDKAKLDGIANNANNYTHPNHTGDVTSLGDGVTAISAGVIVDADVNAAAAIGWSKISKTGSSLVDLATKSAGDLSSGTLLAARLPALTGDITSSAGSATTAISAGVIVNADVNASAAIDASKIGTGVVSNAEFGYLDGVTSAIQTQLGTKWGDGTLLTRSAYSAYQSTTQSIPVTTPTKVLYQSENFDHLNEGDSTGKFTATAAGIYLVTGSISINESAAAGNTITLRTYINGTGMSNLGKIAFAGIGFLAPSGTTTLKLAAGDYVELYAISTIAVTTDPNAIASYFKVTRIA